MNIVWGFNFGNVDCSLYRGIHYIEVLLYIINAGNLALAICLRGYIVYANPSSPTQPKILAPRP